MRAPIGMAHFFKDDGKVVFETFGDGTFCFFALKLFFPFCFFVSEGSFLVSAFFGVLVFSSDVS